MDDYMIAVRLIHITALMLLSGAAFLKLYAGFKLAAAVPREIVAKFDAWLRRLVLAAAIVAFVSALAWWDSLAVSMGGAWSHAFDPETLGTVLFSTQFGAVWIWRIAFALALMVTIFLLRRSYLFGDLVVAGLSAALLMTLAGTSHAAMHGGLFDTIHQAADALHLLCAGLWIGGLVSLAYILVRAAQSTAWMSLARHVVPRFSRAGYGAVAILLVTGCINASFLVSPAHLLDTDYGRVLIAKVCLFVLMVALALINRGIFVPPILSLNGTEPRQPSLALRNSILVELSLGLLVLGLVSVLGALPPVH